MLENVKVKPEMEPWSDFAAVTHGKKLIRKEKRLSKKSMKNENQKKRDEKIPLFYFIF